MYKATVDVDEDGHYFLILPQALIYEMDWKVEDELVWVVDNNKVYLKKVEKDET